MKKQLKDLMDINYLYYCKNRICPNCPYSYQASPIYYPNLFACRLDTKYIEQHPDEWIELEEEEKIQTQQPQGFIEFHCIDEMKGKIVPYSWLAKDIKGYGDNQINIYGYDTPFTVEETYEEIKAKIAEALK